MLRAYLRRRRLVRLRAARLVARHGDLAPAVARETAIAASRTSREALTWHIVDQTERQLGVRWEPSSLRRAQLER